MITVIFIAFMIVFIEELCYAIKDNIGYFIDNLKNKYKKNEVNRTKI